MDVNPMSESLRSLSLHCLVGGLTIVLAFASHQPARTRMADAGLELRVAPSAPARTAVAARLHMV